MSSWWSIETWSNWSSF